MKAPIPKSTATPVILQRPVILRLDAPAAPGEPECQPLADAGVEAEFLDWGGGDSPTDHAALARADFIITRHTGVDAAMIAQAARCLLILHLGPGSGPGVARIDLEAARQAGIYVASIPDYATESWVEETLKTIKMMTWEGPLALRRPLKGLRLGLVGFGQVGRALALKARERDMEVWACDPFAPDEPFATTGARRADLRTLMGIADVVSLHVPLGPATRGMIGASELNLMKPYSFLIDTAAPELVDLDALAGSLERGRPAAAVFDDDLATRMALEHPLLNLPGVIHGAHRAGVGEGWAAASRRRAGELLVDALRGNRPAHLLIDPPCPRHILLAGRKA